jgi:hypothetical protein
MQITDSNGWTEIQSAQWIINNSWSDVNSCHIRYVRSSNIFQLLNDAGTVYQGALTPGTNSTIGNSQCQIQGSATTITGSGNTMTIQMRLTFLPAFAGSRSILIESNDGIASTAWHSVGTWLVP